jgi:hypothetical protein
MGFFCSGAHTQALVAAQQWKYLRSNEILNL